MKISLFYWTDLILLSFLLILLASPHILQDEGVFPKFRHFSNWKTSSNNTSLKLNCSQIFVPTEITRCIYSRISVDQLYLCCPLESLQQVVSSKLGQGYTVWRISKTIISNAFYRQIPKPM